jgi:hypothetical protein
MSMKYEAGVTSIVSRAEIPAVKNGKEEEQES